MTALARTLLVAAVVTLAATTAAPARAATISMGGSQIAGAVVADLAYFYRHEVKRPPRFEITRTGTDPGIADLSRRITDAALVSRELERGDPPGLRIHRLAWSGVCLASNDSNPVPQISRALLQDIVAGRVTSWSQVPGSGRTDAIAPVALDPSAGGAHVFEQVFLDFATPVSWQPVTFQLSIQVRDYMQTQPAAFGYLDLAVATGAVHRIAYEGHPCTRATVRDGSYPARRPIAIVTRKHPKKALRRFLAWTRTSRTARRVIAAHYIPVARAKSSRGQ
jgi:ABC-type phosphate transport system substrate-binding protein